MAARIPYEKEMIVRYTCPTGTHHEQAVTLPEYNFFTNTRTPPTPSGFTLVTVVVADETGDYKSRIRVIMPVPTYGYMEWFRESPKYRTPEQWVTQMPRFRHADLPQFGANMQGLMIDLTFTNSLDDDTIMGKYTVGVPVYGYVKRNTPKGVRMLPMFHPEESYAIIDEIPPIICNDDDICFRETLALAMHDEEPGSEDDTISDDETCSEVDGMTVYDNVSYEELGSEVDGMTVYNNAAYEELGSEELGAAVYYAEPCPHGVSYASEMEEPAQIYHAHEFAGQWMEKNPTNFRSPIQNTGMSGMGLVGLVTIPDEYDAVLCQVFGKGNKQLLWGDVSANITSYQNDGLQAIAKTAKEWIVDHFGDDVYGEDFDIVLEKGNTPTNTRNTVFVFASSWIDSDHAIAIRRFVTDCIITSAQFAMRKCAAPMCVPPTSNDKYVYQYPRQQHQWA